ncbi:hypothetical protein AN958_12029 [Leucoagaricus sp. SymC.cos]|nr:hypothetical protein AN958_12029 [Leucoagaricus sp. SymC.cos]
MTEHVPSDVEIYASCQKYDASLPDDAAHILWYIWRSTQTQFSRLQTCLDAIKAPELHGAIRVAHSTRNYHIIKNWVTSRETLSRQDQDDAIATCIRNLLDEVEEPLTKLINGRVSLPTWPPKNKYVRPEIRHHLERLKIPIIQDRPNLLLHEWGSFKHDSVLKERLENVFMPNNHTFLVNTSGSGKTRLLLEGLCDKWGLYFTSTIDSSLLGSSDVQNSINSYVPDSPEFRERLPSAHASNFKQALQSNQTAARHVFRRVLLSRLIIFHHFVGIMERERTPFSPLDVYRERWLLLQLQPRLAHPNIWDIFDVLTCKLAEASDRFVSMQTQALLERIRNLCSDKLDATQDETPIFCVLDEAQYAATRLASSFRSDRNGCHRPILREIVRAWQEQTLGRGVFMIVAGTGLSKDVVDQTMASAIMKDSRYRWCSDTGAFATVRSQQRYIAKYLPESLLESTSGKRLLDRLWYWLHGRHRFTAGYVVELILNGFQQPHRLLNAYVEQEAQDPLPKFSQYKLDFSKIKNNSDMESTIQRITTHYLMRSIIPCLGQDEIMFVEYGFARFNDSDTRTIAIDEPLVLLAALSWMADDHQKVHKLLARSINLHAGLFNGFENYIVFCLDLIFSTPRRLSDVFSFHGKLLPSWANMEARLVSMYFPNPGELETSATGFHDVLAYSPKAILLLLSASINGSGHHTKWSGAKHAKSLGKKLLLHAMGSITPSKYFLDRNDNPFSDKSRPRLRDEMFQALQQLPGGRRDAGKYSVLRAVASFPARPRMNRHIERDPDSDGHPIASLNMDFVKRITRGLSPRAFLHRQEVTIDSEDQPSSKKRNRNRESRHEEETTASRKRMRLKI